MVRAQEDKETHTVIHRLSNIDTQADRETYIHKFTTTTADGTGQQLKEVNKQNKHTINVAAGQTEKRMIEKLTQ